MAGSDGGNSLSTRMRSASTTGVVVRCRGPALRGLAGVREFGVFQAPRGFLLNAVWGLLLSVVLGRLLGLNIPTSSDLSRKKLFVDIISGI